MNRATLALALFLAACAPAPVVYSDVAPQQALTLACRLSYTKWAEGTRAFCLSPTKSRCRAERPRALSKHLATVRQRLFE